MSSCPRRATSASRRSRLPSERGMCLASRPGGGRPAGGIPPPRRRGGAVPGEPSPAAPRLSQPAALPRGTSLLRPGGAVRARSPRPRPVGVGASLAPPPRAAAAAERWRGGGGPVPQTCSAAEAPPLLESPAGPPEEEKEEDAGGTLKGASPAHPRPLSRAPSPAPVRGWRFPRGLPGAGPRQPRPRPGGEGREGGGGARRAARCGRARGRAGAPLSAMFRSPGPPAGGPGAPRCPRPPRLTFGFRAPPLPPGGSMKIPNAKASWGGLLLSHVLQIVIHSSLASPFSFFYPL